MEQTATFFLTIVQDLDLNDPLAAAGYQTEVTAFFKMVRGGQLKHSEHQQLVEAFCKGVDRDGFWPLAQMAVPELRGNQGERYSTDPPSDLVRIDDIVDRLTRIPRRSDSRTMPMDEAHMASQRHLMYIENLVTGGGKGEDATSAEAEEIRRRFEIAEAAIRRQREVDQSD